MAKHAAIKHVRAWTTDHVQKVLTDHDLADCCEAVRKREVDGDMLLTLTEGQLALWKRDLNLKTIKKLARFVEDVIAQPEKYQQIDVNTVGENKLPLVVTQLVSSHSGKSSPLSDTASWDTDFSDDQLSGPKPQEVEAEVDYNITEELALPEKPAVPTRPPVLAPKPATSCDLPKPPVPLESSYGHVKSLVSGLNLPDNTDQFDEEEYESLDGEALVPNRDALAKLLKKSLEARAQAQQSAQTPDATHRQVVKSGTQTSTLPQQTRKSPSPYRHHVSPRPDLFKPQEPYNCGYMSDEYESIKDNEKPILLPPGSGTEYYLQPLQSGGAPPLPAKPLKKAPDVTLPSTKPPSPPRRKSDDSTNSPGNSGDGVVGLFGELFRKIRGPATPTDYRERTPTLEKKAATVSTPTHKPPSVDQRPTTFQSTQRPLPPTPEDKKVASGGSRRTSKVGLTQQSWYHNVDRKRGEEMLRNGEDGSFLVRPSLQSQNSLTLTLWYNKRLYNIGIRQRADSRYALGTEKTNEQSFPSVEELVENYQSEKLVLYSGGEKTGRTLLTTSPVQSGQPAV